MQNPTATYRLQFHKNFGFEQLQSIIQYLVDLGVATVYASPVFKSVPGSTHGYDGLDPNQLNPEIGTLEQLKRITKKLRSQGVGWLQDIVPNHMAFNPENRWLRDVLEKGQHSEYAGFFDIDWNEKLMVPFLGNDLETVIAANELKLVTIDGKKQLQYYDSEYPISEIDTEGKNAGNVRQLLEAQSYRLCSWQETDSRINYRRFFTINGLICMNMHDPDVFNAYHQLAGNLVKEGVFQGLRIDHIDGLYDPATYLRRLRERCGDEVYITVEKILQPQELLPSGWEAQGTTGYDFLALVNNLLTNAAASQSFTDFYQQLTGDDIPVEMQVQNKKAQILHHHMRGELDNLADLFRQRDLVNKKSFAAVRTDDLREAIAEWLIHCPVYRFYGNMLPLEQHEADAVQQVFNKIKTQNPELVRAVGLLEEAILHYPHQGNRERNEQAAHFYKRCMQFSGPLMAKGVEDTLMYTWNRFIAHNEVGDQPSSFGIEVHQFHAAMQERQRQWPFTMNATSTHDTKRGEDVRARLNVLTDLPEYWFAKVNEWKEM
ncbi:MAG TPA: malto-oligosyltrehalose synthase, partial [Chitinophagaceae bacterium]